MRALRSFGTIWHVPRLALLAIVVLAISPAATGAEKPTITISGTGDIAMAPSGSGAASFFDSGIRKALRAPIALGNLEGTLATGGSSKCGPSSRIASPSGRPVLLGRAQAGRLHDHEPRQQPRSRLRGDGPGGDDHRAQAGRPSVHGPAGRDRRHAGGGTKVAFVGFAPYPWAQSLLDIDDAVKLVRKAERKADVVVVTMHAGAEGSDQQHVKPGPNGSSASRAATSYAFSRAVVRAGADLVVGHGPHVLRGIEWYRGRVIAYSLGNFLGNGTLNVSGVSGQTAVLRATLRRDGSWADGKLVPVQLTAGGLPRVDPSRAALATVRKLSRADFGRNAVRISPSGTLLPPAWRPAMKLVRADLPSGTVTFLFTDVEGSTKLLQELGADAYAEALAEHRRAIREACEADNGVEVDTQGDAFFFAFPTAPGGVAAAAGDDGCARVRARSAFVPGCTRGRRYCPKRATSAMTSTVLRASLLPATAAR